MSVKIKISDSNLALAAPYDPSFPAAARNLGGRWSKESHQWIFDARDEAVVRELARETWGTDGSSSDGPVVTVRVPVTSRVEGDKWSNEIKVAGVRLAHRPARDSNVVLAANVRVVEGGFRSSGGSVRYPHTEAIEGTVLEVRDLPIDVAQRIVDKAGAGAHIVDVVAIERAALMAERERLARKLADVDARLANLDEKVSES